MANTYETYKDSGIAWIGEIPSEWKVCAVKNMCRNITDGSHFSLCTTSCGKHYITVSDVYDDKVNINEADFIAESGEVHLSDSIRKIRIPSEQSSADGIYDWSDYLRKFIQFNDRDLLVGKGTISHEQADEKAYVEYDKFRIIQDQTLLSDFDLFSKAIEEKKQ